MQKQEFLNLRLENQYISRPFEGSLAQLLNHMGPMQAQNSRYALMALEVRSLDTVRAKPKPKEILKTWLNRGTLQLISEKNYASLLHIYQPILLEQEKQKQDLVKTWAQSAGIIQSLFEELFVSQGDFTRKELDQELKKRSIKIASQDISYHVFHEAVRGRLVIIPGSDTDYLRLLSKPQTSVSPEERQAKIAHLAKQYIASHGPVSFEDFAYWSGIPASTSRPLFKELTHDYDAITMEDKDYYFTQKPDFDKTKPVSLLPAFDEYYLGYKNRPYFEDPAWEKLLCPGQNGIFKPMIVSGGMIIGTWKFDEKTSKITISSFRALSLPEASALDLYNKGENIGQKTQDPK